jgi:hypothetical protein
LSESRTWKAPNDATIQAVMAMAVTALDRMYPGADLLDSPMSGADLAKQTPDASTYFLGLVAVTTDRTAVSYAVRFDARTGKRWLTVET